MKRFIKGISLLSLILIVFQLHTVFAQATGQIRIMSYNIRYKNSIDSLNVWEYRRDHIAGLVLYHQPGVLGVQEATPDQIADLVNRLPLYKWYGVPRVSGKSGEFTAIFYRHDLYALLDSGTFWFSETPDVKESKSWDAMYPRTASWAKLKDKQSGAVFYFFNTHLDHRGEMARRKSAAILCRRIDSLAKGYPVVLTGDFNSTENTAAYKRLTADGTLKDALYITKTPHYGPVNTSSGFIVSSLPIRARIDYIFVNKGVEVLQHATLTDQTEGRYYSDHLPVIAVLKFPR